MLGQTIQIPPTAVGGSDPFYLKTLTGNQCLNPINGSWWMVQIVSTDESLG